MLFIMDRSWCVMTYNLHPVKSMDVHYDIKLFLIFIGYHTLTIMMINYNTMMMSCHEKRYWVSVYKKLLMIWCEIHFVGFCNSLNHSLGHQTHNALDKIIKKSIHRLDQVNYHFHSDCVTIYYHFFIYIIMFISSMWYR